MLDLALLGLLCFALFCFVALLLACLLAILAESVWQRRVVPRDRSCGRSFASAVSFGHSHGTAKRPPSGFRAPFMRLEDVCPMDKSCTVSHRLSNDECLCYINLIFTSSTSFSRCNLTSPPPPRLLRTPGPSRWVDLPLHAAPPGGNHLRSMPVRGIAAGPQSSMALSIGGRSVGRPVGSVEGRARRSGCVGWVGGVSEGSNFKGGSPDASG